MSPPSSDDLNKRNQRILLIALAFVLAMVGVSFAAVPLYRLFCQTTGLGGTTMRGEAAPANLPAQTRRIQIRFDAMVDEKLPWQFKPEQQTMDILVGQTGYISYLAKNKSNRQTAGVALYNVNPPKAGKYFIKTQCFCFDNQPLGPRETAHMPVLFYLDPQMLADRNMRDVEEITLSYQFYPAESKGLNKALEKLKE